MNNDLKKFFEQLYFTLQEIDSLVTVDCYVRGNKTHYLLSYNGYYDDESPGREAKNNSELKKLCNLLSYNLEHSIDLPILKFDTTYNSDIIDLFINFYTVFKDNDILDSIAKSVFYDLDYGNAIECVTRYSSVENKEEIVTYLLHQYIDIYQNDDNFLMQTIGLFSNPVILSSNRDTLLFLLDEHYDQILKNDTQCKIDKDNYRYTVSIRERLTKLLKNHEQVEYIALYKKYTQYGLEQPYSNTELFQPETYIFKSFKVNISMLISKCPLLLDQSDMSKMINKVICLLQQSNHIKNLVTIRDIQKNDNFELEIKLKENANVDNSIHKIKNLFLDMCIYYNDNILFKNLNDNAIDTHLKTALSALKLEYDMKYSTNSISDHTKQKLSHPVKFKV